MKQQIAEKSDGQGARNLIIEAGITLFAERGYASTSVREIVERAGVSKPVLYYYFKSKEGLFRAILDWAAEKQEAILERVLETPGTAFVRLIHLYRLTYQGLMENKNLVKMLHNMIFGPPQGAPPFDIEQYHRRLTRLIKTIYMDGIAMGEVKDADLEEVGILVLSLLDFCFHLDHLHPESMDPERPERLLRLAFQGLKRG